MIHVLKAINQVVDSKERQKEFFCLWKKLQARVVGLASRWNDESEYEDINDYQKAIEVEIASHTQKQVTITKMLKRPFGFECLYQGAEYRVQFKYSTGEYTYKRIG